MFTLKLLPRLIHDRQELEKNIEIYLFDLSEFLTLILYDRLVIKSIVRKNMTTTRQQELLSKVPEVTLAFWLVKILATTLGETGGDALSMSALNHNYLLSTIVFGTIFAIAVTVQILAKQFHPIVYWITIVATTTVGTTLADFVDRSLGIGYAGGSTILFTLLMGSLWLWYRTLGSVAVETVQSPQAEMFYPTFSRLFRIKNNIVEKKSQGTAKSGFAYL